MPDGSGSDDGGIHRVGGAIGLAHLAGLGEHERSWS